MAFVGSIQKDLRGILAEMAPSWKGRPVYVGCSGNFTVERIALAAGVDEVHGSDVSLYSCALGGHLAGKDIDVWIKDPRYSWMSVERGAPLLATLLLAMEYFKFDGKSTPYHVRMARAYRAAWPDLHAKSVKRVKGVVDGLAIRSFSPMDVVDFVEAAPADAVVVSFPPTYEKGYERLYKRVDEVFGWDAPSYDVFDAARFDRFIDAIRTKETWVTLKDERVPALDAHCVGVTQSGLKSKPVYVYASSGRSRVTTVRQVVEDVPIPRLSGEAIGPVALVRLSTGQLNTLRSEYLAPGILPTGADINFGVLVGGKLAGALAFTQPTYLGDDCDMFQAADFCVAPSIYRRLSKLILAVALTHEVKGELEQKMCKRVRTLGTTVYTHKPVSMKYRGIYRLKRRLEISHGGDRPKRLVYEGDTGRWSLSEAFAWWQLNHGERL